VEREAPVMHGGEVWLVVGIVRCSHLAMLAHHDRADGWILTETQRP
jgi:hypothetical protein